VRVDQSREESGIAQIDDLSAGWAADFRADFGYGIAIDKDFARGSDVPGFDVEQTRGVEDDWAPAGCRAGLR